MNDIWQLGDPDLNEQFIDGTISTVSETQNILEIRSNNNESIMKFLANGDIYWRDRLITSDIDLVNGLKDTLLTLRKDAEYRRKLTLINNVHEQ